MSPVLRKRVFSFIIKIFFTSNIDGIPKDGITTPEEAEALKKQLFDLEINGQTFKDICKNLNKLKKDYSYREVNVKPTNWRIEGRKAGRYHLEENRVVKFFKNIVNNIVNNDQ